ncbi:MAG TPA: hypothetical protein VIY48_20495 [Candidatus Paceibacterota bacterium]
MPNTPTQNYSLSFRGRFGDKVYQRTAPGHGNVPDDPTRTLQVRAYVAHNYSHSPAQLACRAKFRNAMAVYATLSDAQKKDLQDYANRSGISGMNLFMSIEMRK